MTPKVTLLSHTPQPEKLVAAAARMCYSAASADTIWEGLDEEKTQNFIDMLAEIGHESPVEHAMDALRARIAEKLKGTLLVAPEVRLVEPGGIERAIGKAKHVDDRREK